MKQEIKIQEVLVYINIYTETPRLESMFDKADPDWRSKSDIKWNFTKFLIDRNGNVIARFEPTKEMSKVAALVKDTLDTNK